MKIFLSFIFLLIVNLSLFSQTDLVPYRLKDKWGYSDLKGNIKIKVKYDSVGIFKAYKPEKIKVAIVKKNNKFGLIDENGKKLIPVKYSFLVQEGHLDTPPEMFYFTGDYNTNRFLVKKKNKFGIVDSKNKIIIPIKYDTLLENYNSQSEGYDYFGRRGNKYYKLDEKGKKTAIDAKNFKKTRADEYFALPDEDENSSSKSNKWQKKILSKNTLKMDSVSKVVVDPYVDLMFFKIYHKGKVGMASQVDDDKVETYILKPQYDSVLKYTLKKVFPKYYYIFLIKEKDKIGVVDYKGDFLMPLKAYGYQYLNGDYLITSKGNLLGFYSFMKQTDIKPMYEYIKYYKDLHLLKVKKDGKWGYVSDEGFEYFKD